jgi:hypothetical protein
MIYLALDRKQKKRFLRMNKIIKGLDIKSIMVYCNIQLERIT